MKVKVGSTYICDGPDRSAGKWTGPIGSFPRSLDEMTQIQPVLRGAAKAIFDRGNLHNTFRLVVQKLHSDADSAHATIFTLASLAGTITFEYGATGSKAMTGIARLKGLDADGLTVRAEWELIGGAIT